MLFLAREDERRETDEVGLVDVVDERGTGEEGGDDDDAGPGEGRRARRWPASPELFATAAAAAHYYYCCPSVPVSCTRCDSKCEAECVIYVFVGRRSGPKRGVFL